MLSPGRARCELPSSGEELRLPLIVDCYDVGIEILPQNGPAEQGGRTGELFGKDSS
jgi:hypothetical protein